MDIKNDTRASTRALLLLAASRSAGRRHQHIYVMVKGDRRKATEAINNGYRARGYTYPDT